MSRFDRRSDHERLGALLRQMRTERGLRQSDVAKKLGLRQSIVSKYETGERRLTLIELREICCAMGISLCDLVREFEEL